MDLRGAVVPMLAFAILMSLLFSPSLAAQYTAGANITDPREPATSRNISALFAGVEERLQGGRLLNLTSDPVDEPAENETSLLAEDIPEPAPEYDDGELAVLVEANGISLMLLSLQNVYALHAWDEVPAKESGAALRTLAARLRRESAALVVSEEREALQESFISALESYEAAGMVLQGNTPLNMTMVDAAVEANRQGSEYIREASGYLQDTGLSAPAEIAAISLSLPRPDDPSREDLMLLQRSVYEDRIRANEISIMLESASSTGVYYIFDERGEAVFSDPGRTFLLVKVKVTNLGHKGESRTYKVRTPDLRDFTLQYRGTTYAPMKLAVGTSLGVSYAVATLDRYEARAGYIVFDIPEALPLDECFVRVNLGDAAPSVWALGKSL